MFRRFKRALDEALEKIGITEEDVDQLLDAMRDELIDTKAQIPQMESHIEALEREGVRERDRIEDCVRRASQAEAIGDQETMEVAVRFAEQHRSRLHVAEQKLEAAQAELVLKRREAEEMTGQLKEAIKNRGALAAQARRAKTIESTRGVSGHKVIDEFDRMADRTERGLDVDDAEKELDREMAGEEAAPDWKDVERRYDRTEREAEADAMLEEMKRRMGMDYDES